MFCVRSGYSGTGAKCFRVPFSCVDGTLQGFCRSPHILKVIVEGGKTEAKDIGRPEVSDDAAGDERLHDRITLRMGEADVAAARAAARTHKLHIRTVLLDKRDEPLAHRSRLADERVEIGLAHQVDAFLERDRTSVV